MNPKILAASPIYEGMDYCRKRFLDRLRELEYDNYDILIVDNSDGNDYFEKLKKENGILVIKDKNLDEKKMNRVISSRNFIIQYALENNYDYILMMDCDVITPRDIIKELLSCDKEIVSGIYFNIFIVSGKQEIHPVAWQSVTSEEFEEMKKQVEFPEIIKSHLDLRRHLTKEEVDSKKLLKVLIPSAGCMLLSRKVFEKVRYGLIDTSSLGGMKTTDDVCFILRAGELGFESYCYTKIRCEHLISKKFEQGERGIFEHPVFK